MTWLGPKLDELVRSFPSAYQLLPTYECLDVGSGMLQRIDAVSLPGLNDPNLRVGLAFHSRLAASIAPTSSYVTHVVKGIVQPTSQSAALGRGGLSRSRRSMVSIRAAMEPLPDLRLTRLSGEMTARVSFTPSNMEFYKQLEHCWIS
jgi:hypothetical protein